MEELQRWDREIVWHAFSQMADYQGRIIQSAQGSWLTTLEGERLLDGVSSLWCNVHGHRHPTIDAAIRSQLEQVAHVTSLGLSHPTTIRLAKKLTELAPPGLNHVFFSSDGSSAVEAAIKMAFQFWRQCDSPEPQRSTFLAVGAAYHGDTLGSVSLGGISRFHSMFAPLLFPVLRGPLPDTFRRPPSISSEDLCQHYLSEYEVLMNEHGEQVAAIIVEPIVQGAAGMVMHPTGFLSGLRRLADRFGTLLIADEIATGMGRTGAMFACELEQVVPDLLCLGKGLSGGYLPLAATLASDRIWNAFLGDYADSKSFFHGHTYGGNPLSAASAWGCLQVFEEEKTLQLLPERIQKLSAVLEPLREHPHVGDVRQRGLIAAVEMVEDKATKAPYAWSERRGVLACHTAMQHGVWMRPLGNVLVVMPPLNIALDDIDLLGRAIRAGVESATR